VYLVAVKPKPAFAPLIRRQPSRSPGEQARSTVHFRRTGGFGSISGSTGRGGGTQAAEELTQHSRACASPEFQLQVLGG